MAKENKRVQVGEGFEAAEILALGKAVSAELKAFKEARDGLKTGVYQIDVLARIKGDVEIGIAERVPDKFNAGKYLVAALGQLTPAQRKKVLSRPVVRKEVKAVVQAEVDQVKARLPKHKGPPKLTVHLLVNKVPTRQGVDGLFKAMTAPGGGS